MSGSGSATPGAIGGRHLARAAASELDLIVVGAGITGCWATLLASRAGLRVALVERGDFGSGVSRASHRILHGGFRYLQSLDLGRLRESVVERRAAFSEFPDLVSPLRCLMPLYGEGLKRPSGFRAALLAYSVFASGRNRGLDPGVHLPVGAVLSAQRTRSEFPTVRSEGLRGGGVWYDGVVNSHARLTMTILRRAAALGAYCLNHTTAVGLETESGRVGGVRVEYDDEPAILRAPRVLNAAASGAGGWATELQSHEPPIFRPALAFNLLLDHEPLSGAGVAVAPPRTPACPEVRTYFLVGRHGRIAAGTTHLPTEATSSPPDVSASMLGSMINDLNAAVPGLDLTTERVLRVDAGLLPAETPGGAEPTDRPLVILHADTGGPAGLVTLLTEKYTTARHAAWIGLRSLQPVLIGPRPAEGGRAELSADRPEVDLSALLDPEWPTAIDAPDPVVLGALAASEGVEHLDDLILGRSDWGETPDGAIEAGERLAGPLGAALGWGASRLDSERERLAHAIDLTRPKFESCPTDSGGEDRPMTQSDPKQDPLRVLVLAPHSFYIDRGTPIDVDILVRALCERGNQVDLACYHEGEGRDYEGLTIHRIRPSRALRDIGPGFTFKKLWADLHLAGLAIKLVRRNRYDVIHAGEEAVFIARLARWGRRVPYVYDMDSSIAQQVVEKMTFLRPLAGLFNWFEARAIRGALACAPVCHALGDLARARGAKHYEVLHDISQIDPDAVVADGALRREHGLEGPVFMYVGNFEPYQGVDLLLGGFAEAVNGGTKADLVIAGGSDEHIEAYRAKAAKLGLAESAHFIGRWPVDRLGELLAEADVLVAPRVRGINTPQKIFPYMHSGKAVLLTDLPTHTQIVDGSVCKLGEPTPEGFGRAIAELASDPAERARLGAAGRAFVERDHVYPAHRARVDRLYDHVRSHLRGSEPAPTPTTSAETAA